MTRIFLSHSNHDNPRAFAVAQWLHENGWEDFFLDIIPRQGIAAGEAWKLKIHDSMDASAAGIFLISRGWMASKWCQEELRLAYSLNKLIFGVVVDDLPRDQIPPVLKSNWQVVDLHSGRDHDSHTVILRDGTTDRTTLSRSALASLKEGLHRAKIAPEHFAWPPEDEPDRAPWRGLSPMEPQDAGIFFGRDAQTARALDAIRKLREGTPPRLLAIVGASGAGKSSFLRAGLIPRLRRDDRNYLTLPLIRPEGGALDAFAQSLTDAAAEKCPRALGDVRGWIHAAANGALGDLTQFLTDLADAHRLPAFDDQMPPTPMILLSIDQGEALFQSTGRGQGGPFLSLLAKLLRQDSPRFLALITIRSDSYEDLQNARELIGLNESPFSLSAIARGEYGRIITGPVERLQGPGRKLEFDPAITETLLAEFDKGLGRDALPLLAFTLDRLYCDYHTVGKITLADYQTMGGVAGSINAAVEQALQSAMQRRDIPSDRQKLEKLLRNTMIPWFAGIDPETGTARRNVCTYRQLPPEALPLVDALVEQRLLTRDGETIEPAHETLLREWRELDGWLIADRERLITLEALRRAAAEWQAKGRHKDYLVHKAGRLEEAERLAERPDLWQKLGPEDRAYLLSCWAAVKRGVFLRRAVAAAFAGVVGLGVITTGYLASVASQQAEIAVERDKAAEAAEAEARTQSAQAAQSRVDALVTFALARAEADPISALKLVLAAWPKDENGPFPTASVTFRSISNALANTGQHEVLRGHEGWIYSVSFSPDGSQIASGSADGTLRLWDADNTAAPGERMYGHYGAVNSVAFSRDGSRIVSGGEDGTLRLWDATTRAALGAPLRGHEGPVYSAAFSPDGSHIVSGGEDGTLRMWDAISGVELVKPLNGHQGPVLSVAFSPDGSRIVSGGADGRPRFWSVSTGATPDALLDEYWGKVNSLWQRGKVISVAFSPDGSRIVSGGEDGMLRVWDATTGAELGEPLRGHEGPVLSVAFSPDDRRIASGSDDGTLRLWDVYSGAALGAPLRGHDGGIWSIAFSPDGGRIVSGNDDETLRIWDVAAGTVLDDPLRGHEDWVRGVDFSSDGSRLVSGSIDGMLRLWDANSGAALGAPLRGHDGGVLSVAFSPDNSRIVSGGEDGTLRMWSASTGAEFGKPLRGHEGPVFSVAFSPDGSRIVSGSIDGTLRLWDVNSGSALGAPLRGHDGGVLSVAFSPDNSRIASGGEDGTLRLWNAATGEALGEPLRGHESPVLSLAVSPDSRRIISGGDDTLRLWDVSTGAALGEPMRGHDNWVLSVAISPEGSRIVSGSVDGTLRMWDASTGSALGAPLRGHEGWVFSTAFSPDGTRIVSGGEDDSLRLWGNLAPPGNILQVACQTLPLVNGRRNTSTEGLAAAIGIKGLALPADCDAYDPPLPPEFRQ